MKVDFIGIGVEKAATYWVADCLREHPEVSFSKQKELAFFNDKDQHFLKHNNPRYSRGIEWYGNFFHEDDKIKGEYTPTYIYSEKAPLRIKKHFPKVKLITTLRDPVKRAFSQYLHDTSIGIIPEMSFEEAIKKYDAYLSKGYYSEYLENWYKVFPKSRLLVLLTDDIKKNPIRQIKKVYKHVGVEGVEFNPPSLNKKPNPASTSRFPFVNRFLINSEYKMMDKRFEFMHKLLEDVGARKAVFWASYYLNRKPIEDYPKIKKTTEKRLRKLYRNEVDKLGKIIKRDLSIWL